MMKVALMVLMCGMALSSAMAAAVKKSPREPESLKGLFPENVKTIGILMPSSVVSGKVLDRGVQMLEEAGYRVKLGDHVRGVKEQPSAEVRAQDFEKLWLDPEVDILFMARGGTGAEDIIGKIDWIKLRARNMRVIGFSDITLILNTMLSQKAGHPYSGPMLSSFTRWDADSRQWFRAALDGVPLKPVKVKVLKPGAAKGLPMGGHLVRMHTLFTKTSLAPSTAGRIVFLECTAKHTFDILKADLEEMRDRGYLKDAAAVVFADFRHKGEERKKLDKFLFSFAQTLSCPVFAGYPYGHCSKSYLIDFFRELEISPDGMVTASTPDGK